MHFSVEEAVMPAQEKIADMDSDIRLKAVFGGYVSILKRPKILYFEEKK